jgi:hypothetical protein
MSQGSARPTAVLVVARPAPACRRRGQWGRRPRATPGCEDLILGVQGGRVLSREAAHSDALERWGLGSGRRRSSWWRRRRGLGGALYSRRGVRRWPEAELDGEAASSDEEEGDRLDGSRSWPAWRGSEAHEGGARWPALGARSRGARREAEQMCEEE